MSLLGKISLVIGVVSFIIITINMFILGWLPVLSVFLGLFVVSVILSLIIDHKFYLSFLLMKTTKNGMSMGVSFLMGLVFFSSLAYLSKQFEKSIDITEEKINSLSPQTVQVLNGLKKDMRVILFYTGDTGKQKKEIIKQRLFLFKQESDRIKDYYHDVHLKNKLAQEYLNELSNKDKEDVFVFVEYKGKKILVKEPFNEEQITSALIKATRREENKIYFLSGHGERELSDTSRAGVSELGALLTNSSFKVRSWSFTMDGLLPQDVSVLAIIGPERGFLKKEIQWLERYLKEGGKMIVALDPDKKHNLKEFLKIFGVDYKPHYIIDKLAKVMGGGDLSAVGIYYDQSSPVTKVFRPGAASLFHKASNLKPLASAPAHDLFSFTELVRTDTRAVLVSDLKKGKADVADSQTVALLVEDKKEKTNKHIEDIIQPKGTETEGVKGAEGAEETDKTNKDLAKKSNKKSQMRLAVFGDSDFLSNELINMGLINKDLILNTFSYLVDELELVSIRPKSLKETKLILKTFDRNAILAYAVTLPIFFFICGFIIWLRRSGA